MNKKVLTTILFCFLSLVFANYCFASVFFVGGMRFNKKLMPLREIKREHVVMQNFDFSCGAAGLSTLLNYYLGNPISESVIIKTLLKTVPLQKIRQRRGFSLYDLKNFAKSKGYIATGYKMDIDFLKKLHKPVLVPIKFRNFRHFVIIKAVVADHVLIADPAAGNTSMTIDQFNKLWIDGISLLVEDPRKKSSGFQTNFDGKDLLITDHKMIGRILNPDLIRTTVYPGEF
ncbi:MAG: C39 family peptidase [Candidatus Omnitrophica bacterium]|nr:C39 family peptidase [Candidatus Omnitrophota bacterium]